MLHYGGMSPKRHYMLANTKHVARLWVSKLRKWAEKKKELEKESMPNLLQNILTKVEIGVTREAQNYAVQSHELNCPNHSSLKPQSTGLHILIKENNVI